MKQTTTIEIVKELEKIKNVKSRNSYKGAWGEFILAITWLTSLYMQSFENLNDPAGNLFTAGMFITALLLLLHSFYLIIRYIFNRKLHIIFEALLESNKQNEKFRESDKTSEVLKNPGGAL